MEILNSRLYKRSKTPAAAAMEVIIKAKERGANMTVPEREISLDVQIELTEDVVRAIAKRKDQGGVLTFDQMIPHYKLVRDSLKGLIGNAHCKEGPDGYDLNFFLLDLSISNFHGQSQGLDVGAAYVLPALKGMPMSHSVEGGGWRKLLMQERPLAFVAGARTSFIHRIGNPNGTVYDVIRNGERTMPVLNTPSGESIGRCAKVFDINASGPTRIVVMSEPVPHGHAIKRDTAMPPGSNGQQYVRLEQVAALTSSGVRKEVHVVTQDGSYQGLYMKQAVPGQSTDGSTTSTAQDYMLHAHKCIERLNASRCTNFEHSGLWWNFMSPHGDPISGGLTCTMHMTILPIVEYMQDVSGVARTNETNHLIKLVERHVCEN